MICAAADQGLHSSAVKEFLFPRTQAGTQPLAILQFSRQFSENPRCGHHFGSFQQQAQELVQNWLFHPDLPNFLTLNGERLQPCPWQCGQWLVCRSP